MTSDIPVAEVATKVPLVATAPTTSLCMSARVHVAPTTGFLATILTLLVMTVSWLPTHQTSFVEAAFGSNLGPPKILLHALLCEARAPHAPLPDINQRSVSIMEDPHVFGLAGKQTPIKWWRDASKLCMERGFTGFIIQVNGQLRVTNRHFLQKQACILVNRLLRNLDLPANPFISFSSRTWSITFCNPFELWRCHHVCELLMCYNGLERLEPLSAASRNTHLFKAAADVCSCTVICHASQPLQRNNQHRSTCWTALPFKSLQTSTTVRSPGSCHLRGLAWEYTTFQFSSFACPFGLSLLRSMWTLAGEGIMRTAQWAKPARLLLAASVTCKQWSMWPIQCFSSRFWMNHFRKIAKKGCVSGESPSKR